MLILNEFQSRTTEEELNHPIARKFAQSFMLVYAGSQGLNVSETAITMAQPKDNLLLAYMGNLESFLDATQQVIFDSEEGRKLGLDEVTASEYAVGYDFQTNQYYVFSMDNAIALSSFFETKVEIYGLPVGSVLYDAEEDITPDQPLKAYTQDGVYRTFPHGTYREIV